MEGAGPNQWSWHKAKLAMAMVGKNRHYLFKEIQRRHFDATAVRCGYGKDAEPIIGRIVERTDAVIGQVSSRLPAGFPQHVADSIFAGLKATVVKLQSVTC
jgi:serine/threonine-protein kinase HipA